jgi:hypothetical protein
MRTLCRSDAVAREPLAAALLTLLRDNTCVPAVELTRIRLTAGLGASLNKSLPEQSRFEFDDDRLARQYGPNIVVVYEPDSVEDLALIWNLRARFGHPRRLPLALPYTTEARPDLAVWAGSATRHFGFGHNLAITSFSVEESELADIGRPGGFDVVEPWKLMRPVYGYCIASNDMAHFVGGKATVPSFQRPRREMPSTASLLGTDGERRERF